MEIQTVKIKGEGYLLNGNMHVPEADGNREYELIKQWIAEGNEPEPEFTEEEIQKQELQVKISEAKQYLTKTDYKFYNGYKPKEGEDLVEIERLRDEAREFLRANKGDK
jgi:hypothetical protein